LCYFEYIVGGYIAFSLTISLNVAQKGTKQIGRSVSCWKS